MCNNILAISYLTTYLKYLYIICCLNFTTSPSKYELQFHCCSFVYRNLSFGLFFILKTQHSRSTSPWERTVRIRFSDFIFFNVNWLPSCQLQCKAKNDKKIIIINFYKIIGGCLRRLYKIGLNITPYMTNRCMYCCNCICNPTTDQHHK